MTTTEQKAETEVPTTAMVDPFADVPVGDIDHHEAERIAGHWRGERCRASTRGSESDPDYEGQEPDSSWSCSREEHPAEWRHIALGGAHVLGKWGGVPDATVVGEADPDPGPEFTIEVGGMYKFRNRPTLLMAVGFRREEKVEVLDLTHMRFRVLAKAQLVPAREDMQPTLEQMTWAGKFMAERRVSARETALKQRRSGYFKSLGDLNGILTELELEPQVQMRQVTLEPRLRFAVSGAIRRGDAQRVFAEWLEKVELPEGWTWYTNAPRQHDLYASTEDM